ncbi:MAG TPA: ABC transporter permease [Gemmatimonadaceae bacterium]|nr:ABC transporter permease [Gemmatimonadaceae bacterium]
MTTLSQDLRYAGRVLRKSPLFTGVAILTLALGIGLNTAVFSAVESMLLRPLPGVPDASRLVQLFRTWPGYPYGATSPGFYFDVRARSADVFSGIAVWDFAPLNLSLGGRTERIMGQMVSANFFATLGIRAERGRTFTPDEDTKPGAHPIAVVSHAGWQSVFGGDPQIVGRTVLVNGHRYTVVGVTPPAFRGPVSIVVPVLWVPLMQIAEIDPSRERHLEDRGNNYLNVVARLQPGVTIERAQDRMKAIVNELRELYPNEYKDAGVKLLTQSEAGIHPRFHATQVALSTVVMAVVVLLLLIACVNVANLFLARARDRSREMAVRLSLGASRGRLVRQLLTESIVFSLLAGAAGVLVGWAVIALVNRIRLPVDIPIDPDLQLNGTVLLFTFVIALITGMLFGLVPALQATRPSLVPALKGEAPAGGSRSRMSRPLVVAQVALSLVLLVCSGLFVRNLRAATTLDKGFTSDNLLLAGVDPAMNGYNRTRVDEFYRRLLERLREMPGVKAVALAEQVILGLGNSDTGVQIPGYTPAKTESMNVGYNIVTPGYFAALNMKLLRGRDFTTADDSSAQRVLIVNQRFVDRFMPGQDVVGKRIKVGGEDRTIIAVAATAKYHSLGEEPASFMYFPLAQNRLGSVAIHIRTAGDPAAFAPRLRAEVAALDPDLPLSDVRTMNNFLGVALFPARIVGAVLGIFGFLGLVLAAVGVYGVMSYSVSQRTREIGIRMAIGAAREQVVRLVMRQGMQLVVIGTVVGIAGALVAARLLRGILYGTSTIDAVAFTMVPLVLLSVAMLAIWIPARRAASIDPMRALRSE